MLLTDLELEERNREKINKFVIKFDRYFIELKIFQIYFTFSMLFYPINLPLSD